MENKEEIVSIKNKNGENLVGDITFPSKTLNKYPTVLLVHGFGVERNEGGMFYEFAHQLASDGFIVFKFDFSGCGDSEGDFMDTSLSKLRSDLNLILSFAKKRKEVDSDRIGIWAQSFGTSVTLSLMPKVKTLVLSGSLSHPSKIFQKLFYDYNPNGISSRKRSDGSITSVKPQFWKDFKNHDLINNMSKIDYPVLFIHGEKDTKVPVAEMWDYYNAKKGFKDAHILKDADHSLKHKRKEAYFLIKKWFGENLIGKN